MFIALDANNERISIENATKGNQYFCPICGEPLIIRAKDSLCKRAHFAHKAQCLDNWVHDMSEWHYQWQQKFPEEYREVVIEKDGFKHRADICIGNTVIEFQHSPITAEEIAERNNFYLSCGYKMIWVFDATNQIKNSIEDTIDPMKCQESDLCWKRAKRQFVVPMHPQVLTFLQYKTYISNPRFPNQEFEIMLLLTKNSPKNFTFFKTKPYYILQNNFLKEYGALMNDEVLSITDICNKTRHLEWQKKEAERNKHLNALWNARYRRPVRRWHL